LPKVSVNIRSPFSSSEIPLNPRVHPIKEISVFDLYVIISSSILISPYSSGNPSVLETLIVVSH